jgi:hypothetical protein
MGPWIFASVVFVTIVVLLVQRPKFRKYSAYGLLAVLAAGFGAYSINSAMETAELERKKLKIRAAQIVPVDMRLALPSPGFSSASISGTFRNDGDWETESVTAKIRILSCDTGKTDCKASYTREHTFYVAIPRTESRGIQDTVFLDNLPKMADWTWDMTIKSVISK